MSLTASVLGVAALILSSTLPSVAFGPKGEFTGHWEGTLVREGVRLEVSFDFKWSDQPPNGTFTSLTQKAMDYPLDALTLSGDAVHFALGDSLVFDGKLSANEITGTFTDDSAKGQLHFTSHGSEAFAIQRSRCQLSQRTCHSRRYALYPTFSRSPCGGCPPAR